MNKRSVTLIGIILLSTLLVSFVFNFSNFDSWQEKIIDRFFVHEVPPVNIIVIGIDDRSISELGQWPWPRAYFGDAIKKLQNAEVVAFDINFSEASRLGVSDDEILAEAIMESKVPVVMPVEINAQGNITVEPIILIRKHVELGGVNIEADKDGVMRFIHSNKGVPALSAVLAGKEIKEPLRINYKGPAKTFLTIPYIDLVEGKIPTHITEDAKILIGATAPNLHDFVQTPFGKMPGVEFHANALSTLEGSSYFRDFSKLASVLLFLLISTGSVLLGGFFKRVSSLSVSFVSGLVVILGVSLVAFSYKLILPVLYMELVFIVATALTLTYQYISESKEKRFIRKVFQYYLTPDVIEELILNPEKVSLGGEEREMTILFSDIRGFTTISEALSAKELTALLNEYLTAMTDIIMEEGGVVDKYIGDAVMAFWGAPLSDPDQARNACRASERMIQKLALLNVEWVKKGWPELNIGIGLNKGNVVVGNMGSSKRFNYTVMGDEVNFSSRLEGITKQYGVACLVSESVAQDSSAKDFVFRDLDLVLVKGKKEPRRIFDILSSDTFLSDWNKARDFYTKGKWQEALDLFEDIHKKNPGDKPSLIYIERCKEYKKNPPSNWQGVHEFKDK